jgi:hypothetical protein
MSHSPSGASGLKKIATMAGTLGKAAAAPMLQNLVREELTKLFSEVDPAELERLIVVQYPLVREELPDQYKNVLGNVGPQFSDQIETFVRPEQVMHWLANAEEWLDEEEDAQQIEDLHTCAEIISETPGGEEWVEAQCIEMWDIAGVL